MVGAFVLVAVICSLVANRPLNKQDERPQSYRPTRTTSTTSITLLARTKENNAFGNDHEGKDAINNQTNQNSNHQTIIESTTLPTTTTTATTTSSKSIVRSTTYSTRHIVETVLSVVLAPSRLLLYDSVRDQLLIYSAVPTSDASSYRVWFRKCDRCPSIVPLLAHAFFRLVPPLRRRHLPPTANNNNLTTFKSYGPMQTFPTSMHP